MQVDTTYLLNTLKKAIQINSITPVEEDLAAFFADEIRKLGIEPEWHEVAPRRPNVYATADLGPSDEMLLLTGHSDTVGIAENWETDPFDPVEKDGKLFGLGSYDMKSGVVCALAAFKALVEDKAQHGKLGKVAFAVTVDEEGYGLGAKELLKTAYGKSAGVLLTEPFWNPIPIGLTGKVLYKLTLTGKMAHGFNPQHGINAVEDAGKILAALEQLHLYEHPQYGRGNYSTLKIEGGYQEYAIVVPERCEVIITRLTVPGESRETALNDMRTLVDALDLASTVTIETPPPFYEPYLVEPDARLMQSFNAAHQQTIGVPPAYQFIQGITDANIYVAEGGIPTITFGPRGGGAHECNEFVTIDTLVPVAQTLVDCCIHYYQNRPTT